MFQNIQDLMSGFGMRYRQWRNGSLRVESGLGWCIVGTDYHWSRRWFLEMWNALRDNAVQLGVICTIILALVSVAKLLVM